MYQSQLFLQNVPTYSNPYDESFDIGAIESVVYRDDLLNEKLDICVKNYGDILTHSSNRVIATRIKQALAWYGMHLVVRWHKDSIVVQSASDKVPTMQYRIHGHKVTECEVNQAGVWTVRLTDHRLATDESPFAISDILRILSADRVI